MLPALDDDTSSDSGPELETLDVSNDTYYKPIPGFKSEFSNEDSDIPEYGSKTLRHSLPAYDLWKPFFPPYQSEVKLRDFHRPKLRHFTTGPQKLRNGEPRCFQIKSLSRSLSKFQRMLRLKVIKAINDGLSREEIIKKHLLIRKAKDLTAKQGELFLFEYCEEYPPVLNQNGMAANIKNYIRTSNETKFSKQNQANLGNNAPVGSKKSENSQNCNDERTNEKTGNYKFGYDEFVSDATTTKQIYYDKFDEHKGFQVIENNMFRAPIYQHTMSDCNFIIIRTRNNFYIRQVNVIFTVGQTMPLVPIPEPSETAINKFRCDLSNNMIHRLFMESKNKPACMDLDKLAKCFPDYDRSILRKRLKNNGAICQTEAPNIFYKGFSKYGHMSVNSLRKSFTPEQYCLNNAMLAARQRLRELNYTDSMICPSNNSVFETEVLAAPWKTSQAVLNALNGRNYLDLKAHLIDPTGRAREGFSCLAWSKSPLEDQQKAELKLDLNQPKLSGHPFKFEDKNPLAHKINREKQQRLAIYRNEAKFITKVQSDVLSSREILSSDSEDADELDCDEEFDAQLSDLDKMVVEGQTSKELSYAKEEEERRKMLKDFCQNGTGGDNSKRKICSKTNSPLDTSSFKNKVLRIIRTYKVEGVYIQRSEIVREPRIIAEYIKAKGGFQSQESNLDKSMDQNSCSTPVKRQRTKSLASGELCRAEGLVLTISKKVINQRDLRHHLRKSRELYNQ